MTDFMGFMSDREVVLRITLIRDELLRRSQGGHVTEDMALKQDLNVSLSRLLAERDRRDDAYLQGGNGTDGGGYDE